MSEEKQTLSLQELEEQEAVVYKQVATGLQHQKDPTQPDPSYLYAGSGRMWVYYKSIDWPQWWDDFNGTLIPKKQKGAGRRKYKTVWQFIQEKTKVKWQRQALWQMIGPDPKPKPGERLKVPYLGDWEQRRKNGFYAFDDPLKIVTVAKAIKDRESGLRATRALAPMIARRLAFWNQVRDMIIEAFGGRLLDDEATPAGSGKNKIDLFLKWQSKVEGIILNLEDQWAKIHGVNPLDPGQQYLDMVGAGAKAGAAAALTGALAAGMHGVKSPATLIQDGQEITLPEGMTIDQVLMAQMLKGHEQRYPEIPLPGDKQQKPGRVHKTQ